jgi:F-type H+-transporting ATPase subunit c
MLYGMLTVVQETAAASGVAQGIARQPEAAATIQGAGIILAALIEGAALFGLVIALLFKFF